MKKLSLLLVGFLCLSVMVRAGEVISNDTGEDATGLRVVFSSPVLITGFGDNLVSIDTQMLSFEFIFSGGVVEPWDSHWFNYAPASASVMETEWLTGSIVSDIPQGGLTREDLMNLGRTPTYEEIMSVIAEYPGEDEPLYVPADDEAIWLTDLEGHADIYDNDSVNINYAEWFDQSQITEVYALRNGIKMEFLPDGFTVLTNDQMKTFTGTPAIERTPASSHKDHAIFGFSFWIVVRTSKPPSRFDLTITVQSPVKYGGETYAFVGHNFFQSLELPDVNLIRALESLADVGFSGISLGANHFMRSDNATDLFAQYTVYPGEWMRTPTESELRHMLRLADQVGLDTELRVEVWLTNSFKSEHEVWRGAISPANINEWFDSYYDICAPLALIAQQESVDILVVGVELNSMMRYTSHWQDLVSRLREIFAGRITIAEGTAMYLAGFNTYSSETSLEMNVGKMWSKLDLIGMTLGVGFHQGQILETSKDQRFRIILENLIEFCRPAFEYYRASYPGLPIFFSEMFMLNYDGALIAHADFWSAAETPTARFDHQEYVDTWAAFLFMAEYFKAEGLSAWTATQYFLIEG